MTFSETLDLDCNYAAAAFLEPTGWSEPVVVPVAELPTGGTTIDAGEGDEERFCAAGGCTLTEAQFLDYALTAPGTPEDHQTSDAVLAAVTPGCALAGIIRANRAQ